MRSIRMERSPRTARWRWDARGSVWQIVLITLIALKLTGVITWSWWWVLSPLWISGIPGVKVFSIRVKQPQSIAGRCWNAAQDVLSPIVVFTPIVLKLTGVITWLWWWVLSPLWISGILGVLALCGLLAGLAGIHWVARRQMRMFTDDQFMPPNQ